MRKHTVLYQLTRKHVHGTQTQKQEARKQSFQLCRKASMHRSPFRRHAKASPARPLFHKLIQSTPPFRTLLQRNKSRGMSSPNPRPPMFHGLIRDTELPQIEPHHLRLDLHLVEFLPRVNPNHRSNHLWHHNHVPQVRLHQLGLLVGLGFLFGLSEFFNQAHGFALQTAVESATSPCMDDVTELLGGEVEQSGKKAEGF